ncbi:MAG: heparinase II/III family protein [Bacteroidota bacterium]|nr:heparinase II/III family protein [Bacteroidota bacterium]
MKHFVILIFTACITVFGCAAQKVTHPCLLFTPDRIQQAKQRIKNEAQQSAAWNELKQKADELLKKNELSGCDYLALAYCMTDDRTYADKVKKILLNTVRGDNWSNNSEMLARKPAWRSELQLAHKCYLSAIAYDAIYNTLTETERKEIAAGLDRLGLQPSLGDWLIEPTRIHSLNSMGHNWWTACVCMGGILAISVENELPQARLYAAKVNEGLPEWFAFAGDVLQNKPKSFDSNGGMYESVNYANFGISEALLFRLCWKNAFPGQPLPGIPQLSGTPEFFMHACYPRTGNLNSLNFGDSHLNITAENTLELSYALGQKSANTLWYLNQVVQGQNRDGYFRNTPIGFLYFPDLKNAPALPDLPTSQLFGDIGWATIRTSWQKDATLLAVKSGHTWNHSHADANSFILFHKGIDLIKDGGNCWYPFPEYRGYFFQSQAHNVVLFNGEGQPTEQQYHGSMLDGHLSGLMDGGNIKYVLADGTGPVANNFIRNFRHFLWIDQVIYLIDDLKTYKPGKFEWLWHTEGTVKKEGYDLIVSEGKASVAIRPIYPEMLAPSEFVHDYPDNLYVEPVQGPTEDLKGKETYYSFHYPAEVNKVKGLTAIILKDSAADTNLPKMERMDGKNWIGVKVRYNGKVTDIYINLLADGSLMHSNSWIWADGWETDAYLLAVTYPENGKPEEASDLFISYGSALRRNGISYMASLSKLDVIQKNDGKKVQLHVQGQPFIHATFFSPVKPGSLLLNGKQEAIRYEDKQLSVTIDDRK